MKCPKKEELILFYYRELSREAMDSISEHIKACASCAGEYQRLESFLSGINTEKIQPSLEDYQRVSQYVRSKAGQGNPLFDKAGDFLEALRRGLCSQPKLVPVLAVLIIAIGIFVFTNRPGSINGRNFDILQIEIELSLDDHDYSVFDSVYDEMLLEDMVIPGHSTLRNRNAAVHVET